MAFCAVLQHFPEEQAVLVVREDGVAIVASQNDVLRDALNEVAG